MARVKGLHVHPIKDGVFSIITKGFATDEQIFGKPSTPYVKTRDAAEAGWRQLDTGKIEKGVYLVLKNADIFGIEPTYQVTEWDGRIIAKLTTYNIYKQV